MPLVFPASGFGRTYQQTAKAGVTVTASATPHTMGSWVTLIDPLSYDCFGLHICAVGVSVVTTDTRMLMNIGVAPTGGGNEQIVLPYLDLGHAGGQGVGWGKTYFFPLYIPAGKAVRAQCQALIVSDTVTIRATTFELPPHGFAEDAPQEWTQYGATSASSQGTDVTSGNGAYGTEVQITASTTRNHRWFHVGIDWGTNTVVSSGFYRVRLARDTGATDVIGIWDFLAPTSGEDIAGPIPDFPVCCPVAAGSELHIDIDGGAAEPMTVMVYAY
jgi:hypothetical protein